MSLLKKGRISYRNNVFDENISASSTPSALVKTGNDGKIDTNFLKMNEIIPPGTVVAYAGTTAPSGWLLCNGAAVSRTTFAALFTAIGTAHGIGDGSTTFNIPDYRGRFLRGVDGGVGRDPDRTSRTAMNTGGATGDSVGSVQGDAIRNITGTLGPLDDHTSTQNGCFNFSHTAYYDANSTTSYFGGRVINFNAANVVPTGGDNRPTNAYVNYIIKT